MLAGALVMQELAYLTGRAVLNGLKLHHPIGIRRPLYLALGAVAGVRDSTALRGPRTGALRHGT
jgi:hypothetical protein